MAFKSYIHTYIYIYSSALVGCSPFAGLYCFDDGAHGWEVVVI